MTASIPFLPPILETYGISSFCAPLLPPPSPPSLPLLLSLPLPLSHPLSLFPFSLIPSPPPLPSIVIYLSSLIPIPVSNSI